MDNGQQSKGKMLKAQSSKLKALGSKFLVLSSLLIALFSSCDNKQYQPKPRGYFRIDFPEKQYVKLDSMNYNNSRLSFSSRKRMGQCGISSLQRYDSYQL